MILLGMILTLFSIAGCLHKTDLPLLTSHTDDQRPVLIKNGTLFTGNPDEDILENVNILVRGDTITLISLDEINAPDAQVIDAGGKVIIPGLIDSHVHTHGSGSPPSLMALPNPDRNMSAFLYAGITTVIDKGGAPEDLEEMSQKIEENQLAGSRLYYSGRIFTAADGHPAAMIRKMVFWPLSELIVSSVTYEVDSETDITELIRENKNHGARFTKIVVDQIPLGIPSLNSDQVARIVKASNMENFTTVAHIGSEDDILTAMEGGVRFFIHGPYRSTLSEKTVEKMKRAGCIVQPTLAVFDNLVLYGEHQLSFSELDTEIADPVILEEYKKSPPEGADDDLAEWLRNAAEYKEIKFQNAIKMKNAGIPLIAGSDSANVASFPGSTLHREMELLVTRCGFSPLEAVSAATYVPGKLYAKITDQPLLGYIREGAPADLLILNGDFRDDITQTQNIHVVVYKGKMIRRHVPEK